MYFWYLVMKGWVPSFEETWPPFTQGCKNLFEIGSVVLENTGMLKVYDDDNDDNCQTLVRWGKKIKETPKCVTVHHSSQPRSLMNVHYGLLLVFYSNLSCSIINPKDEEWKQQPKPV